MTGSRLTSFKIVSRKPNRWVVEVHIANGDFREDFLIEHVREIKQALSNEVNVPVALLRYDSLIDKKTTEDGFDVTFELVREAVEQGRSEVRIESITTPEKIVIPNMRALIDLYLLDPFDNLITFETIESEIEKSKIHRPLVDEKALREALATIKRTHKPIHSYLLAEGTLPSIGMSAVVEFSFHAEQVESKMNKLMGATKVFNGDLLCVVKPPTRGSEPGHDVFNKELPPLEGAVVELIAGDGVKLSPDGLSCYADRDGVVKVGRETVERRDSDGFDRMVKQVKLVVEPLRVMKGSEIDSLTTTDHVEIVGPLKEGAKIITQGRVFIDGNVSVGSDIRSGSDLVVTGEIRGSKVNTDGSLVTEGNVDGANLKTRGIVDIRGTVRNSDISGMVVKVKEAYGSNIQADQRVEIDRVASVENDDGTIRRTKVSVGMKDFLKSKMEDDKEFIKNAQAALERVLDMLGPELASQVGKKPARLLLLRFIANEKKRGHKPYTHQELEALRTLVESIEPMKDIIGEKIKEIQTQRRKMKRAGKGKSMVIIREEVTSEIEVEIGDQTTVLEKQDGPITVTYDREPGAEGPNVIEGVPPEAEETDEEAEEAAEGTPETEKSTPAAESEPRSETES